ncbi:response regulator transcription factor [Lihuaxuella thermophila]|uniref:Two-component system, response regulator YesN n=1 Tax=Lihuaxuella thermophila TaxID=1173111 RepID=A0A1H8J0S8_9BACL|nr:response regulator [Lihuaxuella thermophila]SEN73896.1 two-component system, response regulator YesN [Lihuaxuella thermophila]
MKILIADDEQLVRTSLRSMLEELGVPLSIREAENGSRLIEEIKAERPDLAFVDIRMPKVNGLEAIEICKNLSPDTQWIILTGYSEFDYAREALRLGAAHYLLKPVSTDELKEVIASLQTTVKEKWIERNRQFEQEMFSMCHSLLPLQEDVRENQTDYLAAMIYVDSRLEEQKKNARLLTLTTTLREHLLEWAEGTLQISLFPLPAGEWTLIAAWENPSAGDWISFWSRVDELVDPFRQADFAVTVIKGNPCSSRQELLEQLDRIKQCSPLRVVAGINRTRNIAELEPDRDHSTAWKFCRQFIGLTDHYRERSFLHFAKLVNELESGWKQFSLSEEQQKNILLFVQAVFSCPFEPGDDFPAWLRMIQAHAEQAFIHNEKGKYASHDLIEEVKRYIDQHYMHQIGIGEIADKLGVTPNYLSTLFHRKTGTTFVKYLTRIRMLKAKELLKNPSIQIQQVAERVGYYSPRHFTKLFVRFFGCYPSEYRDGPKAK